MKHLLILTLLTSCGTLARSTAPDALKSVPTSQSLALEVAIEHINAQDSAWVDAQGNVLAAAIMPILQADKAAWDQLDAFYNK